MVLVEPSAFEIVAFQAEEIATVTASVLDALGCADQDVVVIVDESTPMTRCSVIGTDPVTLRLESGAIEDPRRIRTLHRGRLVHVVARLVLRANDRSDGGFVGAPPDDRLSSAERAAWDVYTAGRMFRSGLSVSRSQVLLAYQTAVSREPGTATDSAFEHLWASHSLGWDDVVAAG